MSRPSRPDVQPEIILPDTHQLQSDANDFIASRSNGDHTIKVRRRDRGERFETYVTAYSRLPETLAQARRMGAKIDGELVLFMASYCALERLVPITDEHGEQIRNEEGLLYRLDRVGCRLYMTQQRIADEFGCSLDKVRRNIDALRKYGLIVNQGQGWYEFDCNLFWRGDYQTRNAYRRQQRVRDGWRITDGETTLATPDMEDVS